MKAFSFSLSVAVIFAFLASPVSAERIRWASSVNPDGHYPVLNVPDFRTAPTGHSVSKFGPIRVYGSLSTLSSSLAGVTFKRGQFIAFEANGGSGAGVSAGWESSIWTFADSTRTFTFRYNELKTISENNLFNGVPAVIASGPIASPTYARFFGMCCSEGPANVTSYILFNVRAMNINALDSAFRVTVQGWHEANGSTGEGTPDPDAYGVLDICPVDGICRLTP